MRDENHFECSSLTGNQHVVRTDRRAARSEKGPDFSGLPRVVVIELDNLELQGINEGDIACGPLTLECAVIQFVHDDRRDADGTGFVPSRSLCRQRARVVQQGDDRA